MARHRVRYGGSDAWASPRPAGRVNRPFHPALSEHGSLGVQLAAVNYGYSICGTYRKTLSNDRVLLNVMRNSTHDNVRSAR